MKILELEYIKGRSADEIKQEAFTQAMDFVGALENRWRREIKKRKESYGIENLVAINVLESCANELEARIEEFAGNCG